MPATGMPLLESKLHAPRRRRSVVARERLGRRLDVAALPPVVLVSAAAGFGKTTLVTEWLAGDGVSDVATAWLSLDRRDSDPAVFWSYVIAAVRKVVPGAGDDAAAMLQAGPSTLDAAVASLLNDITTSTGDVVLVLDDYHLVESIEVHESMRFVVEHLPPQLHLVVATRADPPWPLAGLRARGELLEIRAADLRFTIEEAAAYLHDVMDLELTAADVQALEGRTEGWIAALQLAALSLQGRDDPHAFIAGFAGDDRFIVDYLVDEVLDRQADDVRDFLLRTSILQRLSAPLCAAVTGRNDARAILDALERANLFLVPLDDQRRWYRFHHLFGDVLCARLTDEHPELVTDLHQRASTWFEADGDRSEAIRHALAAADHERAAGLIELAIPDLRRNRQEATQRRLLQALPDQVFADRPVLAMGRIGDRMVTGDVEGVAELLDAVEAWLDPDRPRDGMVVHDHDELRRLPVQAAMYRAGLALMAGDLAATVSHGRRAVDLAADDDHFGRGAAAALVGLAQWTAADLRAAERQYTAAIAEFERAAYLPDILGCSLGLADMQVAQGHLADAERTLTAGLELAAAHGPLRGTADMHVGLAEIHLERNQLDEAATQLRLSTDAGERLALAQHAYRWRVVAGRLCAIDGDLAGALDLLHEAEKRYDTDYSPRVRPVAATTARVCIAAGDVGAAEVWAKAAGVGVDDEPDYLREYEHLTVARLLIATGRHADAAALLHRLLPAAETGGREASITDALMLLALCHHARGDTAQAVAHLGEALTRARPEGIVRPFVDAGRPMAALLEAAVRLDRSAALARPVLAACRSTVTSRRAPEALVADLSSRELDVLRYLRSELSGPEIAAELVVSLNTVRTHTKSIFTKLGVNSRRAAVRRADELGL